MQGAFTAGTEASVTPAMGDEPRFRRRVRPVSANDFQGGTANILHRFEQLRDSGFFDFACHSGRVPFQSPQDFIRHPIADAGKPSLVQQQGLEWLAGMALQGFS